MRTGLAALVMLAVGVSACGGTRAASTASFLDRYLTSDGRVIRHDQGGDITSEGQGYAMLLAEVAGKPGRVRTIWAWTEAHLGRPDGLFAWHADGGGKVEDPQSATDADALIAYALLRYRGAERAALNSAGRRVAEAVLAQESVTLPGGAPLPVAGPWARASSPPTVNPSYLMPGVFAALSRLTGDRRWSAAACAAVSLVTELTNAGRRLPPDWAALSGGSLAAAPKPGEGTGVQYGLDAARVPLWFATGCDPAAHRLAASWWKNVLRSRDRQAASALTLAGAPIDAAPSPVTLVAAAAAALAAGDRGAAGRLQARARDLARDQPTYYGDAWAALGPALLDGAIDPCGHD